MLAVPANTVTEEVVGEEPQAPPTRKRKLEVTNHSEAAETVRLLLPPPFLSVSSSSSQC